jgi:hypothetical protein
MSAFETLLAKVSTALERNGIPYMVIDGQAVLVHGEPRFTGDIDITLGVDTDEQGKVRRITRELSLEPVEGMTEDFVKRNALLTVEDPTVKIAVDFIFSFLPYEQQAIQRSMAVAIGSANVRFATAEDTIIHKLFAGRPLDREDVKSIISMNTALDKQYLKQWLNEFSGVVGKDLVKEYEAIEAELRR